MVDARPIKLILILFVLFSFVFMHSAFADGGIIIYDLDMFAWELQDIDQQLCEINYENGFENMLLSIDVSTLHGEKAAWIFPVPAEPSETTIDVIKGFPRFWGYDVEKQVDKKISDVFSIMRLSQIYTLPFELVASRIGTTKGDMEEGITIHEHIEKTGLTTELITAEDESAFYNYLVNKHLNLPPSLESILDEYIGQEYSFVVSWISDVEKFKQESTTIGGYGSTINTLGVFIKFPTDKIYFPLKPTSVYGNVKIPILIYVIGHVTPELYSEIQTGTQVNYFVQPYYGVPNKLSSFFNGKAGIKNLKYTKIKIDTPSKYLTKDLWIKNSPPDNIILVDFINRFVEIWGIAFFALSSCLASMFAGMVAFKGGDQPSKKKLALFGLWNFLTLIGFIIASIFFKTKRLKPKLEQELRSLGLSVWDERKILFILLFTVFFLIITFVFQVILQSIF
ncbi:hypothetical protein DRN74_02730 [Candidatus Micrarchaeota archaeon]|nr:MAG: hypothetical protein DRN74_02730 [Candidatus Micrarchaeota archaeon]